jgi:hypothetical protein
MQVYSNAAHHDSLSKVVVDANGEAIVEIKTTVNDINAAQPNEVDFMDQRYKIQAEVTKLTIKASLPGGQAAANTELSFGLVDESIYLIRPDPSPDILKFFYAQSPNDLDTLCTFPEEYSGGPDKTEPRVRKGFKDTAVWLPQLKTDASTENTSASRARAWQPAGASCADLFV